MPQTSQLPPDEILKLKLLHELESLGSSTVIAGSCRTFHGIPLQIMDNIIAQLAQQELIISKKQSFIGHKETIVQITQKGQNYLYNMANPE